MATARARLRFDEAVSATVSAARDTGFFFDFDGTIAPVTSDPETALPVAGSVARLGALSELVRGVAVVSARPVAFLRERLSAAPGVRLFGLYGMQTEAGGGIRTHSAVEPWRPVMRRLAERAALELPGEVLVQDTALMVALHYRGAPELRGAVERWSSARAAELGLAERLGRTVVELGPPGGDDQGTVVAREIGALALAWYFGDDLGDLRAFEALRAREERDPAFLGIRVAVAGPETGDELSRHADFTVGSPEDTPALLDDVLRAFAR
ncbi:trehalose-phosphatase [Nonomuraea sp. LPB2021202275-12-8]|uniref:trehalose-phosphatase n=1 Tax=Nonomuraea sp. LPB2021202275-12-8 TaxID=3120159 RepID=UPI00300CA0AE